MNMTGYSAGDPRLYFGGDSDRHDYAVGVSATMIARASNSVSGPRVSSELRSMSSLEMRHSPSALASLRELVPLAGKSAHQPKDPPEAGRVHRVFPGVSSNFTALKTKFECRPKLRSIVVLLHQQLMLGASSDDMGDRSRPDGECPACGRACNLVPAGSHD